MHLLIKKVKSIWMQLYGKVMHLILAVFCYVFRLQKINKNKIVFSSFNGKSYGDSPAVISEYILSHNFDYDIVWLLNKGTEPQLPKNVRRVDNDTLAAMKELSTAGFWIDSHLKFWWQRKRKGQVYIQTFHGCIALKKVDADMSGKIDVKAINRDKYNASIVDYYISNSEFCDNMYRSALLYRGKILRIGCPRNDLFFLNDNCIRKTVKEKLGISSDKKVLLYAPTFRDDGRTDVYNINFSKVLNALCSSSTWGNNQWCIVVRLHPILADKAEILKNMESDIIDATSYHNMQELELVSDIIISDYSSCIFDAVIMNKVGMLYASDYSLYTQERGMYWNYFDLPFPVSQTNDELCDIIYSFDMNSYNQKMYQFKEKINLVDDGNATERLCNIILEGNI